MALINKIREKSGWAVGAIAIGLGIFVVGGDLLGPNSRLMGNDATVIGEIAGEEIAYDEFDAALQQLKANYENQVGRAATEGELAMLREQAWNQLIFKIALEKEYERLGIEVTEDELFDMVQGNNIHPAVQQAFVNPQTGLFDQSQVVQYLQNLDQMGPEARPMWANFEQGIVSDRIATKYNNLLAKSVYVTTAEAKSFYKAQNATANLNVLFVPYATIADSTVEVSDSKLNDYYERNKELYKVEDGRSIEYVVVDVNASKEDSTYYQEEVSTLSKQFASATNDSAFVYTNSDQPFDGSYKTPGDLPEELRKQLPLQEGKVYGPFNNNGTMALYKVMDAREGTESAIRASHILIRPESDTPEAKAAAKAKAQDVYNQIKGGADFAQMAAQHGTDGTASVGGDLGWFAEGRMVGPFDKAVFGHSGTGLLPNLVETEYGYHIVKVTEPKTKQQYKVAAVQRSVEPSETTRDAAYAVADELSGISGSTEEFRENVAKNKSLVKEEAKELGKNQILVNNLNNARELVRWTYANDTEIGDVSPVFEIEDKFVVATLTGKREKGYAKVEDIKEELTAAVRNEVKAEQIMEKLKGKKGTLDQIAASYGPNAMVKTAENVTMASTAIPGFGVEPTAIGKAFGLKQGSRSTPIEGQNGVMIVELLSLNAAPEINDFANVKEQIRSARTGSVQSRAFEAIKEKAEIKDNRVKFF
ncbi:peptidylprolyl isomerase [Pontibacter cellulosilyticus]|uniref:Periplasmic chaperone PpiD n=1 Tax=Pontibacter cellulosilyticus TaxID=1720253 RepID=A0A923N8K4_9BACT|nr:peptidylprolyl isomerase [Pontibacter cellulosilyticus]MBC5994189.1 SurA N-terminal domain-containing protein [Pontibacter cellulosilyticus]